MKPGKGQASDILLFTQSVDASDNACKIDFTPRDAAIVSCRISKWDLVPVHSLIIILQWKRRHK